jgi:hypothetical protein
MVMKILPFIWRHSGRRCKSWVIKEHADESDDDTYNMGSEALGAAAMFLLGEQDAEDCDRSDT